MQTLNNAAITVGAIPDEQIERVRVRVRGPAGAIKASLFEIGNKPTLEARDGQYLLAAATDPESLATAKEGQRDSFQWSDVDKQSTRAIALVEMSERLLGGTVDESTRVLFEDVVIESLSDPHSHIRLVAVNLSGKLGLISRPAVRESVQKLVDDPDGKIADMAVRALDYAED